MFLLVPPGADIGQEINRGCGVCSVQAWSVSCRNTDRVQQSYSEAAKRPQGNIAVPGLDVYL